LNGLSNISRNHNLRKKKDRLITFANVEVIQVIKSYNEIGLGFNDNRKTLKTILALKDFTII